MSDINAVARRVQYSGNNPADAGPFNFTFQVNATTEVNVFVDGTKKTLSTHYTVSLSSSGAGSVSFTSGNFPTNSQTVTISSNVGLARSSVYTTGGPLTAAALEKDFDTQQMILQQVSQKVDRALAAPENDATNIDMTLPVKADRLGKYLAFNSSTGNPEIGPDTASVTALASITSAVNLLGTSAVVEDLGLLATSANVTAMGLLGSSSTVTAMGLLGVSGVITDMGILGTAAIVEDMGFLGTSANVTAMGLLGTAAVVEDMGLLSASAVIEDMGLLGTSANVTAMGVLGTSDNVTAMAALSASAVIADMAILGTDAIVADMAILANSSIVDDLAILASSAIVDDMALLATSAVIEDMGLLATSAVIEDMGLLATSTVIEDMGLLATSAVIEDMGLLATSSVISDMATLAGSGGSPNITSVTASGAITAGSFVIGNADINENDLESIDGITAGTIAASKAAVVDANKDITGFRNITLTGELDAGSLDISGNANVAGEVQTTKIAFTDGDDAMTITDTGLVEFNTGFNIGSDAAGDVLYNNGSKYVRLAKGTDGQALVLASGVPSWASVTTDISGKANLSGAAFTGATTITTADNTTQLTLVSTDADASSGPVLELYRNSSSPADDDVLGEIEFHGENDASEKIQYGLISAKIQDASDGTEDVRLSIKTIVAGTERERITVQPSETVFNEDSVDLDFRVESNGNANMLFVDGGQDAVGIGTIGYGILSVAGSVAVVANDANKKVSFWSTGNGNSENAKIAVDNDGSTTNTGEMKFSTRNASNSLGERMRIDASGNVGIGTTAPGMLLEVDASTGSANDICRFSGRNSGGLTFRNATANEFIIHTATSDALIFGTGGNNERMRIDNTGKLFLGLTSDIGGHAIHQKRTDAGGCLYLEANASSGVQSFLDIVNAANNGTSQGVRFHTNGFGNVRGTISWNNSSTAYNTSSDYRLKENVVTDWDGTSRLKQLKPSRFNFIADADTTVDGFLAHEAQAVVPECVTGTKDEVDGDGVAVMQGIDQSKLVPLLVKTIQELEARITALEG